MKEVEVSPVKNFANARREYRTVSQHRVPNRINDAATQPLTTQQILQKQRDIAPLLDAYSDWHTAADDPGLVRIMHYSSLTTDPNLVREYFERFADPITATFKEDPTKPEKNKIPFVKIEFNTKRKILIGEGDRKRKLKQNAAERKVLQILIENHGNMLSSEDLFNDLFIDNDKKTDQELDRMMALLQARTIINATPLISIVEENGIKSYGIKEFGVDVVWEKKQLEDRICELRNKHKLGTKSIAAITKYPKSVIAKKLTQLMREEKAQKYAAKNNLQNEIIFDLCFNHGLGARRITSELIKLGFKNVTKDMVHNRIARERKRREKTNNDPLRKAS